MGKDIRKFYKNIQSQLSTPSTKAPVLSSLASQTSSSIELITTSVRSVKDKNQTNSVLCSKNCIQNYLKITNNYNIPSCETQRKQNCSIPTTSTPTHHAQRISDTSVSSLNLHTTTILPPLGKEYVYFQNDGKTSKADRFIK